MRRITIAVMGTVSGLVLLFNYHTGQGRATTSGTPQTGTISGTGSGGTTSSGNSSPSGAPVMADGTYTGDSVTARWGPVQVTITVSGGRIVKARTIVHPDDDPRDQEVNAHAVPILNEEAVVANSASIDTVSGATVTSSGYIQSLQSAIDQAQRG